MRSFLGILAFYLFTLPIPGTNALRYGLLIALLVYVIAARRQAFARNIAGHFHVTGILLWLGFLTGWLVFQALWVSQETLWALGEIKGQWLPALLSSLVVLTAIRLGLQHGISRQQFFTGIIVIFAVQMVFSLVVTFPDFLISGFFPQSKTKFTAGKLEISYWNNLLLAFLAVDTLSRWLDKRSLTRLPAVWLGILIILTLTSNLAFGARNGIIGSLMIFFSLSLLVLWHERKNIGLFKTGAILFILVFLAGTLALVNYRLDPRWVNFKETAQIAWQGESDAWLHGDAATLPLMESGAPVEISAYMRISWIRAGLELIVDYPLGVGYGRNAFGHALNKTNDTALGHAHSGLIDWTLGVGLPGLLIWLSFMAWLIWLGLKRYFLYQDAAGLILVLVISGFLGRMVLDSINRDHMLIIFFMVLVALVTLSEESPSR